MSDQDNVVTFPPRPASSPPSDDGAPAPPDQVVLAELSHSSGALKAILGAMLIELAVQHPCPEKLIERIRAMALDALKRLNYEGENISDAYIAELKAGTIAESLRILGGVHIFCGASPRRFADLAIKNLPSAPLPQIRMISR